MRVVGGIRPEFVDDLELLAEVCFEGGAIADVLSSGEFLTFEFFENVFFELEFGDRHCDDLI